MAHLAPALLIPVCSTFLGAQAAYTPRVDLDAGRYLKALWDAEVRLKSNPQDALAWAAKSQALAAILRLGEAMEAANKAVELDPALPDARLARGLARAGVAIQQRTVGSLGTARSALGDLRAAVEADGSLQAGWMALGVAYQQLPGILGGSTRKALACADQLRRLYPAKGDLLAGTVLVYEKRYAQAEPHLKRAISQGATDPQIVYGYLDLLCSREVREALGEEGQNRLLVAEAARLLPFAKGKARALAAISGAYLDGDQPEEAWRVAKEGLASSDAPSLLRVQMGKVAAHANIHLAEGLAQLDLACRESLEGGAGGYQTVHWRRAQILKQLGRTDEARSAAREALKLDPNHRGARRVLEELGGAG